MTGEKPVLEHRMAARAKLGRIEETGAATTDRLASARTREHAGHGVGCASARSRASRTPSSA